LLLFQKWLTILRRFYVDPQKALQLQFAITGPEARHMIKVLRIQTGECICLFDGKGGEYEAIVGEINKGCVEVSIKNRMISKTESPLNLTLAQGLLKERKMDRIIRQITELGVTAWIPFVASYSVPHWTPERYKKRKQRWQRIASEALKQCHRSKTIGITSLMEYKDIINEGAKYDLKIIFYEKASMPLSELDRITDAPVEKTLLVLGPEGGFAPEEVELAVNNGFLPLSLGPRILKAETASLASCTLIQYLFGDMGKKA
jgi:16S rRNA (uracil1498-N3)-methyltransferase